MIDFYAESFSYLNDGQNIVFSKYSIENAEPNVEIIVTDDKLNITNKYCEVRNFMSYQIQSGNQERRYSFAKECISLIWKYF